MRFAQGIPGTQGSPREGGGAFASWDAEVLCLEAELAPADLARHALEGLHLVVGRGHSTESPARC